MDLLAIADFNLVAKHGGYGRAARATGRSKATLSRRVADLESRLELRLFERGTRTLTLTEEGQALYERSRVLLTDLDETVNAIAGGGARPAGRLRISAPLLFCQIAMGKLAAEFAEKYPEVQLEVTSDDRPVDMVEEGYDLVIRVNPETNEALYGRTFLRDRLVVVASAQLKRPVGSYPAPAVMRSSSQPHPPHWDVMLEGQHRPLVIEPVMQLSSVIMVRDAVRAGAGAGMLPISLVSQDLEAGRLVSWGDADGPEIALWALYPSRRLLNARVSAFLEFLKEAFPTGAPEELAAYINT